jgi:hypothetical protein
MPLFTSDIFTDTVGIYIQYRSHAEPQRTQRRFARREKVERGK